MAEASLAPTLTAPTLESEKEEQMVAKLEKPQEVKELLDPDLEAVTLKLYNMPQIVPCHLPSKKNIAEGMGKMFLPDIFCAAI